MYEVESAFGRGLHSELEAIVSQVVTLSSHLPAASPLPGVN